jgi:serine/threonine-protein kinase
MDLAELQRRIDRVAKVDLTPLYDTYRAQGGGDIDGFLAFLGASRTIDAALLRELHGMTNVETPSVRDPAYQGTLLATWAKTRVGLGTAEAMPAPSRASAVALSSAEARFRSISRLGEGAMGAVDIARDVYLRRKVALKTVLPDVAGHPEVFGRFLSEMQITAQLEHPNIVPVYALDVSADGSLGYAMKLVQGRDLQAILDEARAKVENGEPIGDDLALDKRLEYFIKVCDAVEYAHSKGIIHRDLKPANVMIGRHNEVYLMDWGIARPIGGGEQSVETGFVLPEQNPSETESTDLRRTRVGEAIGTPHYMSPEQASGKNAELDGTSDQYALGLILQECVTLKGAVEGRTLAEVLSKAMLAKRNQVAIGNGPGAMPREIDAIVRRATQKDSKDRYPSVQALADDVRRYLRGEAVEALPDDPLRRAGRWLARHRMATLTLLLGIGLVGAAGTIGALLSGQARIEAAHARELRVSQMVAESAIQTQLVDRDLTRYEAALAEFVGAAQIVLTNMPGSDAPPYFEESFAAKDTAPPDFGPSKVYKHDVSVLAPAAFLAPGVAREPNELLGRSLTLLWPAFRALLLGSSGAEWRTMPAPGQRALLADVGVPIHRATLALREGLTVSFPAMAGRPPGDAREAAFYKLAAGKADVVWGTPGLVDGESILPASAAVHDEAGAFRGVAQIEVSLNRLLARPTPEELDYVQSRTLVGRDGTVMAQDDKGESTIPLAPEVKAAIADGKSGSLVATVNGRRYRYTYHPLSSVDWYYVSAADEGRMLDSKQKVVTSDPRKPAAAPSVAPSPRAAATSQTRASPAAAQVTAGRDTPSLDAGSTETPSSVDAGAPPKPRVGGPLPKAATTASGEAPLPPNPFDKWKVYERKKKK